MSTILNGIPPRLPILIILLFGLYLLYVILFPKGIYNFWVVETVALILLIGVVSSVIQIIELQKKSTKALILNENRNFKIADLQTKLMANNEELQKLKLIVEHRKLQSDKNRNQLNTTIDDLKQYSDAIDESLKSYVDLLEKFNQLGTKYKSLNSKMQLLVNTMNQIGHLVPNIISILNHRLQIDAVESISDLLFRLEDQIRKLYRIALQNEDRNSHITFGFEFSVIKELINLRYSKENGEFIPSTLIQLSGVTSSNIKIPPFIIFNLVLNAFKHGQLIESKDEKGRYIGKLEIISNISSSELFTTIIFRNTCPSGSVTTIPMSGTGLNFIKSVLENWNGKIDTQFDSGYSVIDEKSYFTVQFNVKNKNENWHY